VAGGDAGGTARALLKVTVAASREARWCRRVMWSRTRYGSSSARPRSWCRRRWRSPAARVLVTVLPHRVVEAVIAVLFATGAAWLLAASFRPQNRTVRTRAATVGRRRHSGGWQQRASPWCSRPSGAVSRRSRRRTWRRATAPRSQSVRAVLALWVLTGLAIATGAKACRSSRWCGYGESRQ
jgi:hypothetical protein